MKNIRKIKIIKSLGKLRKQYGDQKEYVLISCSCGKTKHMRLERAVIAKSCGCLKPDTARLLHTKHNGSQTRIYRIWKHMKSRCSNNKLLEYKYYGGKGIKVSKRWLKFENFFEDMKSSYKDNLTLERIDGMKGYNKSNCKWATRKEQQNNTSRCVFIEFDGKRLTMKQWTELLNLKPYMLSGLKQRTKNTKVFQEEAKARLEEIKRLIK